jgi:ketosteroid isomerase-like protein
MEHPNVDLLRRAWAAYDRGDVEAFAACLTDDWRESAPGSDEFATLADERPTMELHRTAFPDKHTESTRSSPTMRWSPATARSRQRTRAGISMPSRLEGA